MSKYELVVMTSIKNVCKLGVVEGVLKSIFGRTARVFTSFHYLHDID